jgi:hypothetical protein
MQHMPSAAIVAITIHDDSFECHVGSNSFIQPNIFPAGLFPAPSRLRADCTAQPASTCLAGHLSRLRFFLWSPHMPHGLTPSARRRALAALPLAVTSLPSLANALATAPPPREIESELPGALLRGRGRLRFLGLSVYDARLWVADGFEPASFGAVPLALELVYARRFAGRMIAERSLDEMQRVPGISPEQRARWLEAMRGVFPDVTVGDRITGVHRPGAAARFFLNANLRGEIADPEFGRRFFGIWLSPTTSEPGLRQSLLGVRS